jgi:hypothetical protein
MGTHEFTIKSADAVEVINLIDATLAGNMVKGFDRNRLEAVRQALLEADEIHIETSLISDYLTK